MAESRYVIRSTEQGNVEISLEVISTIIGIAALKVDGVSSLGNGINASNVEKQTAKALQKTIRIYKNEETISVDVALNLKFGSEIMDVVPDVQEKIKDTMLDMIGIEVDTVNIRIVGIDSEEEQ